MRRLGRSNGAIDFRTDPSRAGYWDYYERTLYNHILASQDPASAHGFQCYYVPLRAGGIKTYSNDYQNFTCCHGTGMETNTCHTGRIYAHSGTTLYVNLFISSELRWTERGIALRQETKFPDEPSTRLTLTIDTPPLPDPVYVDAEMWAKIVMNLVSNALKFTPPGGRVTLRAQARGGEVVLEVSDTGIGMTAEVRQRCLDPFFTTERGQTACTAPEFDRAERIDQPEAWRGIDPGSWPVRVDPIQLEQVLLNLAVWTPDPGRTGLPVVVWISGGTYLNCNTANPHLTGAALAAAGRPQSIPDILGTSGNFTQLDAADQPPAMCLAHRDRRAPVDA